MLTPGGKYYFFEHTEEFQGSLKIKLIQFVMFPLQFCLFYCHNQRNQLKDICKVFGSENVVAEKTVLPCALSSFDPIVLSNCPLLHGKATKI